MAARTGTGTRVRDAGRASGRAGRGSAGRGTSAPQAPGVPVGGDGVPHPHVAEIQRSRLLAAAVRTVEELGYSQATVAHITHRARVSRRTFYELFANREECLLAALESVVESIRTEVAAAGLDGLPWRERVRGGLWAVLSFFDREPVLARVCVVQALRGSQTVLERREEILTGLAMFVDGGRGESRRGAECPPLTAEGLVGAGFALVYARLLRRDSEPLTDLMGDLMGMIVLPYMGPAPARREHERPAHTPAKSATRRTAKAARDVKVESEHGDPLAGIPMRLTYRTVRVLEVIAAEPGISNRGVGERAGVSDQGQISKLLARLERLGLAVNRGEGHTKGEPNAWTLTPTGQRVAQTIRIHTHDHREAA
jgi:AcrR family transcriptional regulator/DNA-binding MarR family transcriptional regulator